MTETMRLRVTALTDDRSDVLKNLTECVSRKAGIKETDVTDEDYATLLVCELRRCAAAESEILAVCEELARQDGSVAARALATVAGRVNGNIAADENARRLVRSKLAEIENIADDLCDSNVTMTDMLHELTTTELFLPCREKFSEFGFAGGMFRALVAAMSDKKLPPLGREVTVTPLGTGVYAVSGPESVYDRTIDLLESSDFVQSYRSDPITPSELYRKQSDEYSGITDERDDLRASLAMCAGDLLGIRAYAADIRAGTALPTFSVIVSADEDEADEICLIPGCVVTVL